MLFTWSVNNRLNVLICPDLLFVCATETTKLIQLKYGTGGSALKLCSKHYYSFEWSTNQILSSISKCLNLQALWRPGRVITTTVPAKVTKFRKNQSHLPILYYNVYFMKRKNCYFFIFKLSFYRPFGSDARGSNTTRPLPLPSPAKLRPCLFMPWRSIGKYRHRPTCF